jgi:uncharacterized protein (TIGR02271 family)
MNSTSTSPDQFFGYEVIDSSGNKIGSVDNVWVDDATNALEFIGVKTGWLMGKTHVIPTADAQVDNGTITVPYGQDQVKDAPSFGGNDELSPEDENQIYSYYGLDRSTAPSPTGLAAGDTGTSTTSTTSGFGGDALRGSDTTYEGTAGYDTGNSTDTSGITSETTNQPEDTDLTLSEEELAVGKRQVQTGQVRLRKVVHTEHQEVPVELRREDVEIERIPASEVGGETANAFEEQTIDVPVMAEEPVVEKQARVTGGVRMTKDVETETRTVGGDVRSEDVEVDGDTDDSITGQTSGYTSDSTTSKDF